MKKKNKNKSAESNHYIRWLLDKNLVEIGKQWYRTRFSDQSDVKKSIDEDSSLISMGDGYWDDVKTDSLDDDKYQDQYAPICEPDQIWIEYENIQAFALWSLLANKYRHQGGFNSEKGLDWNNVDLLIKYNISKKSKRKKMFNAIILIETGAMVSEQIKTSKE